MPTTPEPKATNEELLRQVINAQVRGGCTRWLEMDVDTVILSDGIIEPTVGPSVIIGHILEILLDTKGCKAAYGEWSIGLYGKITGKWDATSRAILRSWHSGEGNNVRAALETAVSFLPQQ